MKNTLSLIALLAAVPAFAEETRQLDAHEHGVGQLNIAIDGDAVVMELMAPGADIVGFEYEATSDTDLAAIDNAITALLSPLDLIVFPEAAGCEVTEASAELESEDDHDDHGHEDHDDHDGHDDHDHEEDHAEEKADDDHDHDHDEEKAEDDHDHDHGDDHAEEGHDEHDHDDHAAEASHTEFHAEYALTCADTGAITALDFPYFEAFPNALELEVQTVTAAGANAYEVERDAPTLTLN